MATDVSVGDIEVPYLDVTPADGTTAGMLTVTDPDGTQTNRTVTAGTPTDGTVRLTATPVAYDKPSRWVLHWTVTGTGAGAEDLEVYVTASPVAGGPTWLPGRSRVANYVPTRTLAKNPATYQASGDSYALTFDSTTRPNGVQCDRIVADGAAWLGIPTLAATLYDRAGVCVAVWVAAAIERGWPDTEVSLQRANDLQKLADQMRKDLIAANTAATGTDPTDPSLTNAQLPVYSFPEPVSWGDSLAL